MLTENEKASLLHCRNDTQFREMLRHFQHNTCPFCEELPSGLNTWITSCSTGYWRVKENDWPLPNTDFHLIVVSRPHLISASKVPAEGWLDWGLTLQRIEETYGEIKGGIMFRNGPLTHSAGTVEHLHANIVTTNLKGAVRLTIAKELGGPDLQRRSARFEKSKVNLSPEDRQWLEDNW
jgi:diadenosine tetraphosphate (Ap4A) HIT family hydrolase